MKKNILIVIALILFPLTETTKPQQVFINEIMSSNGVTIPDEDGDFSDWIEIL